MKNPVVPLAQHARHAPTRPTLIQIRNRHIQEAQLILMKDFRFIASRSVNFDE